MYCPRCGQQQLSDEVRFCSRCGLPLASVPSIIAGGGASAVGGPARKGLLAGKRVGVRRGAKLMFFSAVLAPIFFVLCVLFDSPGPLVVPMTVFLAGLAFMVYSVLFGEELPAAGGSKSRDELREARGAQALPPSTFVPASGFGRQRVNTADMSQPPSVTEQTTRLLDEE